MGDSYEALIDCTATPEDAQTYQDSIVASLAEHRLIVPSLSDDCVLDGSGYPPGPGCPDAYPCESAGGILEPNAFWKLRTSGVQVHTKPWINVLGCTLFEEAICPRCQHRYGDEFLNMIGLGFDAFNSSGVVPSIICPNCNAAVSLHSWPCKPHLGFVNLAIVFWNWPDFDDATWRLDVPAMLAERLGRKLVRTCGKL